MLFHEIYRIYKICNSFNSKKICIQIKNTYILNSISVIKKAFFKLDRHQLNLGLDLPLCKEFKWLIEVMK